jgi:hypothetical protein
MYIVLCDAPKRRTIGADTEFLDVNTSEYVHNFEVITHDIKILDIPRNKKHRSDWGG